METTTPSTNGAATHLYLVRHGETDENRDGVVQGSGLDPSLNDTGRAQARALARRFEDTGVDAVYASTLRRAKQTAELAARPHEPISKTYLRDLEEISWGVFEGKAPSPERDAAMQEVKKTWRAGKYDHAMEGGESIRDVQARALRAIDHVVSREAGRTVLVVAHGRYLRILLASILEDHTLSDMHRLGHDNTCVNQVVYDGQYRPITLNCTAHLSGHSAANGR